MDQPQRMTRRMDSRDESLGDRFRHWSDAITRAVGTPWAMLAAVAVAHRAEPWRSERELSRRAMMRMATSVARPAAAATSARSSRRECQYRRAASVLASLLAQIAR